MSLNSITCKDIIIKGSPLYNLSKNNDSTYNISINNSIDREPTIINKDYLESYFPEGIICIWYGMINDIPKGFYICDGTNGTPNLVDKFIIGAGNKYEVGDTGGENFVTLNESELPEHNHAMPNDNYIYTLTSTSAGGGGFDIFRQYSRVSVTYKNLPTKTEQTGGTMEHENRPPYKAMVYIMRKYSGINGFEIKDQVTNGDEKYDITVDNEISISNIITEGTKIDKDFFDNYFPNGLIFMWDKDYIPEGFYVCDGTHNTPDLRDRFIVCAGNDYNVNDIGGEEKHILEENEIPSHLHNITYAHNSYLSGMSISFGTVEQQSYSTQVNSSSSSSFGTDTGNSGGGQGHNNIPPYYCLKYIMKGYN